jgi:lysophospholipase L1-like esterase
MAFAIKPGQTVMFTGDSVTDCGRRDIHKPLGNGYAQLATELIRCRYVGGGQTFINTGISGHKVSNLLDRWTDDVVRARPDWLSILIGVNDLWHLLNRAPDTYDYPVYDELYEKLLARTRQELPKTNLILVTPFFMSLEKPGEDTFRARMMSRLPKYIQTVTRLAKKYKTRLVNPHAAFQTLLKHHPADNFCAEPVHPNATGHLVLAHEWLKSVGW